MATTKRLTRSRRLRWWRPAAVVVAAVSLVMCWLEWEGAFIGDYVNLAVLVAIFLGPFVHRVRRVREVSEGDLAQHPAVVLGSAITPSLR